MTGKVVELEALAALPRHARLIGLDIGSKTTGSLSDVERIIRPRSPPSCARSSRRTRKTFSTRHASWGGWDRHRLAAQHGRLGRACGAIRPLLRAQSRAARRASLAFWDERWSTAAVTRTLIEADRSRARRKHLVDKLAATYILQGALDRLKGVGSQPPPEER